MRVICFYVCSMCVLTCVYMCFICVLCAPSKCVYAMCIQLLLCLRCGMYVYALAALSLAMCACVVCTHAEVVCSFCTLFLVFRMPSQTILFQWTWGICSRWRPFLASGKPSLTSSGRWQLSEKSGTKKQAVLDDVCVRLEIEDTLVEYVWLVAANLSSSCSHSPHSGILCVCSPLSLYTIRIMPCRNASREPLRSRIPEYMRPVRSKGWTCWLLFPAFPLVWSAEAEGLYAALVEFST